MINDTTTKNEKHFNRKRRAMIATTKISMEGNVVSRLNHGQTLRILVLEVVASNISNSSGKSMTEIIYAK